MADSTTFLNIPGNIKQLKLPFVLNKENEINTKPINTADNTGIPTDKNGVGSAQIFSFRPAAFDNKDDGCSSAEAGFLRILPASFYNENGQQLITYKRPNDDISYKLLYNNSFGEGGEKSKSLQAKAMLNAIPSITIREFLQDAKLNRIINIFSAVIGGFDAGQNFAKSANENTFEGFKTKLFRFTDNLMKKIGIVISKAYGDINNIVKMTTIGVDDEYATYILKIPYALYYQLISSTTTNIYEIPYNGKILYQSDGNPGWSSNGFDSVSFGEKTAIGKLLSFATSNIKINATPTWTPADGEPINIEIEFCLYNDTVDAALKNFIFLNTIVPGNGLLQYHIYQQAPNLYDIRINGINRLFMCSASIACESIGVLRTPSEKFFTNLKDKHLNSAIKFDDVEQLKTYIKIPDIYKVKMNFKSLLPSSFNNFIYQYYANEPIKHVEGKDVRNVSIATDFVQKIATQLGKLWDNPEDYK